MQEKCKHLNCLVYHKDGICNCDMASHCPECKEKVQEKCNHKYADKSSFCLKCQCVILSHNPFYNEVQEKSGVEDWEDSLERFWLDSGNLYNNLPRFKQFISILQKETGDKWKARIGECLGRIEKLKEYDLECLGDARCEADVDSFIDQATSIIKKVMEI